MKLQPKLGSQKTLQENLSKIWKKKKVEFNLNQKEAAALMGWTAGALSQYLLGYSKLKPEAIIKLSNFLEVDPTEIDPQMTHFLPSIHTVPVKYVFDNYETKLSKDEAVAWRFDKERFLIRLDSDVSWKQKGKKYSLASGSCIVCSDDPRLKELSENSIWAVLLKGQTKFQIIPTLDLPLKKEIRKQYLIKGVKF